MTGRGAGMTPPLYSIGYGNRAIGDFIALLMRYGVRILADVRSKPYSRFQPDFDGRRLGKRLEAAGIGYVPMGDRLGGRPEDPACYTAGKVDYAKLAASAPFRSGLDELLALNAAQGPAAALCAELKPEACHRTRLIGESLSRRGIALVHIDETGAPIGQAEAIARLAQGQGKLFGG